MTNNELRERDTTQLHHDLLDRRKHLFALRTQAVTEKLEDPSQLRKTRKEIARILTIIHEKQSQAAKAPATSQPEAAAPAN